MQLMPDADDPTDDPTDAQPRAEPAARSGLPSVTARIIAFVAILAAGAAGGFIGWAFVDLQSDGDATAAMGIGALVGAVITAGGVGVVTVLALRAMDEWRTIQARQQNQAVARPPRPDRRVADPRVRSDQPRVR
jgi:hypothetical protein